MKRVKLSGEKEEDESPCKKKNLSDPSVAFKLFDTRILTIPLITDLVFAGFSYSDLLKFSLVSKAWNLTCRGILLDRFRTYLTLSDKSTVQSLEDFYNLIRDVVPGHQHPVNGIRMKINTRVWEWPFSPAPFLDLLSRIMGQMRVKCVSLDMSNLKLEATDFHDIFKTLVIPHLGTIEFLEIMDFDGNLNTLSQQLSVDSLPNLKELNFGNYQDRLKCSTLKRILRASPILKTFPPVLPYQLPTLRCTNKLHLAPKVRFNYMRLTPDVLQLLQDYSALIKHLEINQHYPLRRNKYEGDFVSKLRFFFTTCLPPNLESLDIDLEPLITILRHPMPSLLNVRKLFCHGGQRWFPCLFKNEEVQFAQFLPNLKSVTFLWTWKYSKWLHMKYRSEDYHDKDGPVSLLKCENPASLDSVTDLKLYCSGEGYIRYESLTKIMDLHEVFPCVTYLDIDMPLLGLEDFLKWICESWGDILETLILRETKCLGLCPFPKELTYEWTDLQGIKRKNLPPGTKYSDKLSRLRHLELEFLHQKELDCAGNYVTEEGRIQKTFESDTGNKVKLVISGCRAEKRIQTVKSGVSIYNTILELHPCPRNLELSPMEKIIADKSICRKICKMLPTADLRSCCCVSRSWDAVARVVFHEHGPFTFSLDPYDLFSRKIGKTRSSNKLLWFAAGNQKLFDRFLIRCGTYDLDDCRFHPPAEAFALFLENFDFVQTYFKVLEVRLEFSQLTHNLTQSTNHVIKLCNILLQKLNVQQVQKLITHIEHFDKFFRDKKGNLLLSNLHSIKFRDPEKLIRYTEVFKHLLEDLNCLERIVPLKNELLPLVSSAGKAHCVKQVQLLKSTSFVVNKPGSSAAENPPTELRFLLEFVEKYEPQIETLYIGNDVRLFSRAFQELEPILRRMFQRLCTSSSESLQTLDLNLPFLLFISGVISCPLVALKTIQLLFDEVEFDPQGLLAQIPFSDVAPNLEEVKIMRVIPTSADSVPKKRLTPKGLELMPIRFFSSVRSIKFEIKLQSRFFTDWIFPWSSELWNMEYVARAFPNLTKFSFSGYAPNSGNGFAAILSLIWKSWPGLEFLEVDAYMDAVSIETSILGISKEEWSAWKEQLGSDEHNLDALNKMHYAPTSPSVRNCKNLKLFQSRSSSSSDLVNWDDKNHSWRYLCLKRSSS